ncbi:MAG: pseudouridine synthase [Bacteroidetes bacterium]|nr:MAG: pseudouridine synthase [Bacteroidota bacterium]
MKKRFKNQYSQSATETRYFAIYKPYEMLSQFTDEGKKQGLKHLHDFPPDVYPVGRLDADSEGLLLLTNDNVLKHHLLTPKYQHKRTYCVQVEGLPTEEALQKLREGVEINLNGEKYLTLPAEVQAIAEPDYFPARHPPIRFRANIPTSWLQITLTEGKNRQVRRMTASVGLPTLRLVRVQIGKVQLGTRESGEVWELNREDFE